MAQELLPLFPLKVVLFPDSILPLHIFEERYKQLINVCLNEKKVFGINLLSENNLSKVGCTAEVIKLVKRYDDGRMDILVEGKRRYAIQDLTAGSPALYTVGRVEFLRSTRDVIDAALAKRVVVLHNRLIGIVYNDKGHAIEYDEGNASLSFRIAQKAGMELSQRQAVLELDSENARLKLLCEYFLSVIPRLEKLSEVERVAKNDGYRTNHKHGE